MLAGRPARPLPAPAALLLLARALLAAACFSHPPAGLKVTSLPLRSRFAAPAGEELRLPLQP